MLIDLNGYTPYISEAFPGEMVVRVATFDPHKEPPLVRFQNGPVLAPFLREDKPDENPSEDLVTEVLSVLFYKLTPPSDEDQVLIAFGVPEDQSTLGPTLVPYVLRLEYYDPDPADFRNGPLLRLYQCEELETGITADDTYEDSLELMQDAVTRLEAEVEDDGPYGGTAFHWPTSNTAKSAEN